MKYQKTSKRKLYKKKNRRSDLDVMLEIMEQIRLGKIKPLTTEERDELDKKYQVGKYRPYQIDWERIKQLEKDTREEYSNIMKEAQSKRYKPGRYVSKKDTIQEQERLKQELENG